MSEKPFEILVSKAPTDPEEHKKWAHHMLRIQIAFWVDDKRGCKCAQCGKPYTSVDDWLARNPKCGGKTWENYFVDRECWEAYKKEHKK